MDSKVEASISRVIQRIYLQEIIQKDTALALNDKHVIDYEGTEREELWIKRLQIVKNEYLLGIIPQSQYFFHVAYITKNVIHENKITTGEYDRYLDPISSSIREIEKRYGLKEDEYWQRDKGPKEWRDLNTEYEKKLDDLYIALLLEYKCEDVCDVYINHKRTYNSLVKKGRMEIIGENKPPVLPDILKTYKKEFEKCKKTKSYYSAIIMAGATLETYLMVICNNNIAKLKPFIDSYNKEHRRRVSNNPIDWDLSILLTLCEEAKLIPLIKLNENIIISVTDIGGIIRQARNLVHPGRHLKALNFLIEENSFKDIEAYYYILENTFDSLNGLTIAST